jgi:hypothetical protein
MTAFYNQGPYGVSHYSQGAVSDVAGNITIAVGLSEPNLNGTFALMGDLMIAPGLAGDVWVGFLWNQDTLCPPPPWGADTLCADPGWAADPAAPTNAPWTPSELCDG